MPRSGKKLSAAFVKTVSEPGKYYDQHGLILRVLPNGGRQWVQRLVIHGKRRELGLRTYPLVSLAEARQQAFENRKLARAGGDPLADKRKAVGMPSFAQAAAKVIEMHRPSWKRGGRSAAQWEASLRHYVLPRIGDKRVDLVSTADVMGVLLPIWTDKPETARRVRQRIGAVMKWAVAQGLRQDNPAGDAIAQALPRHSKLRGHMRALPHGEVAGAIAVVRASSATPVVKLAFEFLVLTASRSGEVRLATWDEFDLEGAVWTVPGERMKSKREHRVPLSGRALEVLNEARALSDTSGLVFPSPMGKVLSDSPLSKLLRELDIAAVPHGFRSSFRDWAAECTNAPRAVMEAALAHVVGGVEGAYARSDLFERRRKLMDDWAAYLDAEGGQVVPMVRRHG